MTKQLSDQQVRSVITALRRNRSKVTGSMVREELRRHHGSPGGVSRIYRLLQEAQSAEISTDVHELVAENTRLKTELAESQRRASLAEQREEVHQTRWAMEVDSLRRQLRETSIDRHHVSQLQDQVLELHRKLQRLSKPVVD